MLKLTWDFQSCKMNIRPAPPALLQFQVYHILTENYNTLCLAVSWLITIRQHVAQKFIIIIIIHSFALRIQFTGYKTSELELVNIDYIIIYSSDEICETWRLTEKNTAMIVSGHLRMQLCCNKPRPYFFHNTTETWDYHPSRCSA